MSTPTTDEVTSEYLFAQTTPPDLESDSFFRDENAKGAIQVSMADFMTSGGGRFATAEQFNLVRLFFSANPLDSMQPGESLSKADYIRALGLEEINNGLSVYQREVADGTDDYAERTYIWNSGAYKLSDDAVFRVLADGTRVIENLAVEPRYTSDDFDFVSSDTGAGVANALLESWIDPWGIGRTVDLVFSGTVPRQTYTYADFEREIALRESWTTPTYQQLYDNMVNVANMLWDDGITRFVSDDGGVIKYGTTSDDILTGTFSKSTDWKADWLEWWLGSGELVGAAKLVNYAANGFRIYGGAGNDILVGGDLADGFQPEDLEDEGYFETHHAEWDNGVRDFLYGGAGNDIMLTSSHTTVAPVYRRSDGSIYHYENYLGAIQTLDNVDGTDDGFTIYGQFNDVAGRLWDYSLTRDMIQEGIDNGLTFLDFAYEIGWLYGLRVYSESTGSLLVLGQNFLGHTAEMVVTISGVLGDRDPQGSNPWIIYGKGAPSGGGSLRALADASAPVDAAPEDYNDNIVAGNGEDSIFAFEGDDTIDGGTYGGGNDWFDGGEGTDTIDYSAASDDLEVSVLPNIYNLGEGYARGASIGKDWLYGFENVITGSGNDDILGSDNDNVIVSNGGNDTLTGGRGNDTLIGGAGSDTYIYAAGDGHDVIEDWNDPASVDVLSLGPGVDQNQVSVTRGTSGFWDIILNFGTTGSVTIRSGFHTVSSVIEQVSFNDGTVWSLADLQQRFLAQAATSGNDEIYGFLEDDVIHGGAGADSIDGLAGNDTLLGEAGDDVLIGEDGNDTLIGGTGNDTLLGGVGSDIYVYAVGDGYDYLDDGSSSEVDVLRLTDLNQADVDFMRSGLSLILIVQATGETIFINNQFNPDQGGYWGIERMEFADGSAWDNQQISEIGWIRGTAGNDNLVGTWRQEILEGGAGDDSLSGDWGNDTYIFNAGDGNDTIHEWGNPEATDVLQLGTGINAGSVAVGRGTGGFWDIVLNFGTAGSVTIANGFYGAATVIEEVRFADNTVWTLDDLQSIHLQQAATASDDTIYGFIDRDDVMDGSSGNDSLTGFSGNDTLSGGVGDDSLSGDDGNDILIGGAGNDSMAGGAGSDAFVFKPGFGLDTIADFTAGTGTDDVLEFDNTLFADFEAVLAAASQVGSDTVIAFDVANMVTLKNVTLANLHADDVRFVA